MSLQSLTLDDYVEAFESAYQAQGAVDLKSYLPPADDPLHGTVLRELIRIDLELGWESNRARSLEDYRSDFPNLFANPDSLREIAFEEYRLRRRAGQSPSPKEYARRYGICTDGWPGGEVEEPYAAHSIKMEEVARTYRAFCLAPHEEIGLAPQLAGSIQLSDWKPPAGANGEMVQLFRDLHLADERAAGQLAEGLVGMPEAGSEFLGFHLIGELGRGAFGRVFLARQAALASRPVALKVAPDVGAESQALAQLQHTHIVPVYSTHRTGPLQAVCMPYCGAVTVADVLRDQQAKGPRPREGLDLLRVLPRKPRLQGVPTPTGPSPAIHTLLSGLHYSEAVLWLGARLAEGLHHAHERGILHRDVKPANILLTDEGLPMLLDFNVAEDIKQRGASAALVGGTLPYMAPEHLAAMQNGELSVAPGSDVFSLGIVLFELLTGRFPFTPVRLPPGADESISGMLPVLSSMLFERSLGPPCPLAFVPNLSPAMAAIIRHCLEPDPANRYASARALQEDIERHLAFYPLRHTREPSLRERFRKWRRRHPGLGSRLTAAVAFLLILVAGSLTWQGMAIQRAAGARGTHAAFLPEYRKAHFLLSAESTSTDHRQEGETRCREALARYDVLNDDGWQQRPAVTALDAKEREAVLGEVGDLLLVLAESLAGKPNEEREALRCNRLAERCFSSEELPRTLWTQRAELCRKTENEPEAQEAEERVRTLGIDSTRDRTIEARRLVKKGRHRDGIHLLEPILKEEPDNFWGLFLLSQAYYGAGEPMLAVAKCTACIALLPDFHGAYIQRGLAYLQLGRWANAKADFDRVIELVPDRSVTYLDRAIAWQGLGKLKEAEADLTAAIDHRIPDTRVFFFRERLRRALHDEAGARRDFAEGMRREPTDELSWIARGLARMGKEPDKALADFDSALKLNPNSRAALMNKAHVLAEIQNKQSESRRVLERLLRLSPDHVPAHSGLAVVLARLGNRKEALSHIKTALENDPSGQVHYQAASAFAQTSRDHPDDAETAIFHLRKALDERYGADFIDRDKDLDPIRRKPAFKQVSRLAAMMRLPAPAAKP